jgi:hypothetical protein
MTNNKKTTKQIEVNFSDFIIAYSNFFEIKNSDLYRHELKIKSVFDLCIESNNLNEYYNLLISI